MTIWDEAVVIRDRLVAAGVRAVTDPRRVDPPCVLVVPTLGSFDTNCVGDASTDWSLMVLGPQPGGEDALKVLGAMAAKVIGEFHDVADVEMTQYSTDSAGSWPALRIGYRTVSSWI